MTTLERLEQINLAITAIESGAQEYSIGSRRIKRPDLGLLYKERRLLQQQYESEIGTDGVTVAVFDRR